MVLFEKFKPHRPDMPTRRRRVGAEERRRGGYTMVLAVVSLLVISVLTAVLMVSAVNLDKRTLEVAYQNTQCDLMLDFVAEQLTDELKNPDAELTAALFAQIENQSWPNYLTAAETDKMAVKTYTVELSGSEDLSGVLSDLNFEIKMTMHWETDKTDTIYVNTDDRELVVDLFCRSSEGGYKAIRLRYQRQQPHRDALSGERWLGGWDLLWEETK